MATMTDASTATAPALSCYENGNDFFRANRFDEASDAYTAALQLLSAIDDGTVMNTEPTAVGLSSTTTPLSSAELRTKCLLNRSQCALKLREYEAAIADCNAVLAIDKANVKALLRRSSAFEHVGDINKALRDVNRILELHTKSATSASCASSCVPESFVQLALKSASKLKQLQSQDELVMKKEGTPAGMLSKQQVIRLFFINEPPRQLLTNEWYHLKVCAGNEFGLWNRSLMEPLNSSPSPQQTIEVVCDLFPVNVGDDVMTSMIRIQCCGNRQLTEERPKFNVDGKVNYFTV
jgi:tetratricopeptide (TPR) repeat protein